MKGLNAAYPNPVSGMLNIQSKWNIVLSSVNIYNALGQLTIVIPNANQISAIDVSALKTGTYFMQINTNQGASNVKFIKM